MNTSVNTTYHEHKGGYGGYILVVFAATTRVLMQHSSPKRSAKLPTAASPHTSHGAASSFMAAPLMPAPLEKSEKARGKRKLQMQSSHFGDMAVMLEKKRTRSQSKSEDLDLAIAELIYAHNLDFSVVDKLGPLIDMLRHGPADYEPPTSRTIT